MLADLNDMRCQRVPLYGSDLISTVSVKFSTVQHKTGLHYLISTIRIYFALRQLKINSLLTRLHCLGTTWVIPRKFNNTTVPYSYPPSPSVQERMAELSPVIDRFVMCCDPISVRVDPVSVRHLATPLLELCQELTAPYHTVQSKLQMIMPETR